MTDQYFVLFPDAEDTFDTKEKAAEVATEYANKYRNNYVIAQRIGVAEQPTLPITINWDTPTAA